MHQDKSPVSRCYREHRITLLLAPQEKHCFKPDHASIPAFSMAMWDMARNKPGIRKLTSPLLAMSFFLLLRTWPHHTHSSHPDSTSLPAQAAQPHSVVRASSLNSLSPQQAAVIRATCPSHTLASPLLSSRHSSGRSGEAASCRPQHLHPPACHGFFTPGHLAEQSWLRGCSMQHAKHCQPVQSHWAAAVHTYLCAARLCHLVGLKEMLIFPL